MPLGLVSRAGSRTPVQSLRYIQILSPIPLPPSSEPPEALGSLARVGIAIPGELFKGKNPGAVEDGTVAISVGTGPHRVRMEGALDVVWILTPPHVHGRVGLAVFKTVREGIRKKVLGYLRGWDYTPSAQDYREIAYVARNL